MKYADIVAILQTALLRCRAVILLGSIIVAYLLFNSGSTWAQSCEGPLSGLWIVRTVGASAFTCDLTQCTFSDCVCNTTTGTTPIAPGSGITHPIGSGICHQGNTLFGLESHPEGFVSTFTGTVGSSGRPGILDDVVEFKQVTQVTVSVLTQTTTVSGNGIVVAPGLFGFPWGVEGSWQRHDEDINSADRCLSGPFQTCTSHGGFDTIISADDVVRLLRARMISPKLPDDPSAKLGVDVSVRFPASDPGPHKLKLSATIKGRCIQKEVAITQEVRSNPGETLVLTSIPGNLGILVPELSLDFNVPTNCDGRTGDEIPRFDDDITFDLAAEASSPSVRPINDTKQVKVPLPVLFVHGYTGPPRWIRKLSAPIWKLGIESQFKAIHSFLFRKSSEDPFRTPYVADTGERYRSVWFARYDDLRGSPEKVRQKIHEKIVEALDATYAERINFITHSTGGLVARYYLDIVGAGHSVRNLITVAAPHQGLSAVYPGTNGLTRRQVLDLRRNTVAGFLFPRVNADRFPPKVYAPLYARDRPCKALRPPLRSTFVDEPPPADVKVTNVYAKGTNTSWDLTARRSGNWFRFDKRRLRTAKDCVSNDVLRAEMFPTWEELRDGDGTVAVENAVWNHPDVNNVSPVETFCKHKDLFLDTEVQDRILNALGLPPNEGQRFRCQAAP